MTRSLRWRNEEFVRNHSDTWLSSLLSRFYSMQLANPGKKSIPTIAISFSNHILYRIFNLGSFWLSSSSHIFGSLPRVVQQIRQERSMRTRLARDQRQLERFLSGRTSLLLPTSAQHDCFGRQRNACFVSFQHGKFRFEWFSSFLWIYRLDKN